MTENISLKGGIITKAIGILLVQQNGESKDVTRSKLPDSVVPGITMPCGEKLPYQKLLDIPFGDVRCPCGSPKHWFVKWETQK